MKRKSTINHIAVGMVLAAVFMSQMSPAGVYSHYTFDSDFTDSSGNDRHGTETDSDNDSTIITTSGNYKFGGGAYDISDDKDYVSLPSKTLSTTDSYSIAFWADVDSATRSFNLVIGKYNANDFITLTGGAEGLRFKNSSGGQTDFSTGISTETDWHHYVLVANGSANTLALYVDGALISTATSVDTAFMVDIIANPFNGSQDFDFQGRLDEVWIFDEEIAAAAVTSLYENNMQSPTPVDDTATVDLGTAADINLMANDSYADGIFSVDTTATNAAGISLGAVSFTPGNSSATFTADESLVGDAFFSYVVTNENGSATGSVTVTVIKPGTLLHYTFDELVGNEFADASGKGNTGTRSATSVTVASSRKFGTGAAYFPDARERVNLAAAIDFANETPYSLAFWIRPTGGDDETMVMGEYNTTDSFVWPRPGHNAVRFWADSGSSSDLSGTFDKNWHHFVVVVDALDVDGIANDMSLYIDKVKVDTIKDMSSTRLKINAIGDPYNGSLNFDLEGYIDELWVFDEALDATAVENLYATNDKDQALVSGVCAHYTFDSDFSDASGNGQHGTAYGAGATITAAETKFGGGAANISSDRHYVAIPEFSFPVNTAYSLSFWARPTGTRQSMVMGEVNKIESFVWLDHDNSQVRVRNDAEDYIYFSGLSEINSWHHYVVMAHDSDSDGTIDDMSVYIDKVKQETNSDIDTHIVINAIGAAFTSTLNFDFKGQIDEVWIFDSRLIQEEIDALYDSNVYTFVPRGTIFSFK